MAGVELLHPAADEIERPLEVAEVLHRGSDLLRLAVDQLVRFLTLPELLLTDLRPQRGRGLVPPVLDPVGPAVRPDLVQARTQHVGAGVDDLARELLALVDQMTGPVDQPVPEPPPVHHQSPCPRSDRSASATASRNAGSTVQAFPVGSGPPIPISAPVSRHT